jgi:hypothetical protein
MSLNGLPDPPGLPPTPRRLPPGPRPWLGIALLAVLPVLALAGRFGETWRTVTAGQGALEATVRYPDRFRYKQLNSMEIRLRNVSSASIDTLTVALDSVLVDRFSTVRAIPPFARPWEIGVGPLAPGETALLIVELQAEQYGRHAGALAVYGRDTLHIPLGILILP